MYSHYNPTPSQTLHSSSVPDRLTPDEAPPVPNEHDSERHSLKFKGKLQTGNQDVRCTEDNVIFD